MRTRRSLGGEGVLSSAQDVPPGAMETRTPQWLGAEAGFGVWGAERAARVHQSVHRLAPRSGAPMAGDPDTMWASCSVWASACLLRVYPLRPAFPRSRCESGCPSFGSAASFIRSLAWSKAGDVTSWCGSVFGGTGLVSGSGSGDWRGACFVVMTDSREVRSESAAGAWNIGARWPQPVSRDRSSPARSATSLAPLRRRGCGPRVASEQSSESLAGRIAFLELCTRVNRNVRRRQTHPAGRPGACHQRTRVKKDNTAAS